MRIRGLVAATFTPFTSDGELDLAKVEPFAAKLIRDGAAGAFVCGTTGESTSLTLDERMTLAQRWVEAASGRLPIIVHVGTPCVKDSAELARHSQRIGAAAVCTMGPCFFKPTGVAELIEFCTPIATAAPGLPFLYYHIPSMTGVDLPMSEFLPAARQIPTFAGIKYTHHDLLDFGRCLDIADGKLRLFYGRDETLLAGLALGTDCAVGSTYTFATPLYQGMIDQFAAGNIAAARAAQRRSRDMITIGLRYGGMPAFKAVMGMIGLDCGPVRTPLRNLTTQQVSQLRKDLEAMGFLPGCR